MSSTAKITVTLVTDIEITPAMAEALNNLASIMLVQAEDGLYSSGSPDIDTFVEVINGEEIEIESTYLAGFDRSDVTVEVVR